MFLKKISEISWIAEEIFSSTTKKMISILIGNDAGGLSSTLCDIKQVSQLEETKQLSHKIYTLTSFSVSRPNEVNIVWDHHENFGDFVCNNIQKCLAQEEAQLVFILLSGDASQIMPLSEKMRTTLFQFVNKFPAIHVLVDACQSGCFLQLPGRGPPPASARLCCLSACDSSQFDQDDISVMGFDGGLTADLIDYLTQKGVWNLVDFFNYRCAANQNKSPPIQSILSW